MVRLIFLEREIDNMLDINELRTELPKIGDVLIKTPVTSEPSVQPKTQLKAYACVVTYVHPKNLWYQVEFNIKGNKFKQNYNLIDDNYNDDMKKYWTLYAIEHYNIISRMETQKYSVYTGESSVPKRDTSLMQKDTYEMILEITRKLKQYNKEHNTNMTYGKYIQMIEKENKNEYI